MDLNTGLWMMETRTVCGVGNGVLSWWQLKFLKVNVKNVLNSFWVVFCCEVGVYYGFNFLNLNKKYKKQKLITEIIVEGVNYSGQEDVITQSIKCYNAVAGKVLWQ